MLKLRFILSGFALSPALQNSEKTKLAALSQLSALNFCLTCAYRVMNYLHNAYITRSG